MTKFEPGNIVLVNFPFTNLQSSKVRSALVLSIKGRCSGTKFHRTRMVFLQSMKSLNNEKNVVKRLTLDSSVIIASLLKKEPRHREAFEIWASMDLSHYICRDQRKY